ncbi:helix-turn-helix domain-containing protein [Tumebacillus lipolyticus]|uniref:Helix-turn-helix domain-containing protein n=1 Tax=Tumebacillus lipolyticus TaxID=1280370 RepID=A0ABW4ZZZ6_9BACL
MIDPQETLGQRIRRLRRAKGMTQNELADGFVTISMISQVESGKNTPSVELVQHIAKKLQVPLHALMRNEIEQMETAWKHQLAKVYLLTKEAAEAEPLLLDLLELADLSHAQQVELNIDLAESYYLQQKYDEVLRLLMPIVQELEALIYEDARLLALSHLTIGNAYYQKQSYSNAGYHYRRAYDLTLRFPVFDQLAARIAYHTGITLQLQGNHQEAEFYLLKANDFFSRTDHLYGVAATMMAQAITYKNIQKYHLASESLSTAYRIFQALNLQLESANVLLTKAANITVNEDPQLAINELQDCITAFQENGQKKDLVIAYSKLADAQLRLQHYQDARTSLDRASSLIAEDSLTNSLESAECYHVFARYYFANREYQLAINYALKSSEFFGSVGMTSDQVLSIQIAYDSYHQLEMLEQDQEETHEERLK